MIAVQSVTLAEQPWQVRCRKIAATQPRPDSVRFTFPELLAAQHSKRSATCPSSQIDDWQRVVRVKVTSRAR